MAHYDCNFCGGGVYEGCAPNCGTLMEKYFAMNRSTNKTPPKYDLSEFVGRRQLPGDEKAFDRVSAAFDQSKIIAPTVKTEPLATPKKIPHISEGGVIMVKRYDNVGYDSVMGHDDMGDYVTFDDYQDMKYEFDDLKATYKKLVEDIGNLWREC